jgi:hypothetical protein
MRLAKNGFLLPLPPMQSQWASLASHQIAKTIIQYQFVRHQQQNDSPCSAPTFIAVSSDAGVFLIRKSSCERPGGGVCILLDRVDPTEIKASETYA